MRRGRGRDEARGDRVPPARRRRLVRAALVHARDRGAAVRPRDAGERPRAAGTPAGSHADATGDLPHAERRTAGRRARADGRIELDFPVARTRAGGRIAGRVAGGARASSPSRSRARRSSRSSSYADATAVRDARARLRTPCSTLDTDAVIVTAPLRRRRASTSCCRVFGPRIGIPEDSVTGSAMCVLAPYWQARLGDELRVEQVSARRGELHVRLARRPSR